MLLTPIELNPRKKEILSILIQDYTESALPVASKRIAEMLEFSVSPATIRNELAELEEMGYIIQPHTSAGRIPTLSGFVYYVEHILDRSFTEENIDTCIELLRNHFPQQENDPKQLAKIISKLLGNAVFMTLGGLNSFYTGISYLLMKPEFFDKGVLENIGQLVDQIDDIVLDVSHNLREEETILLGGNSPFGSACSTIIIKTGKDSIFGILGPVRMDYKKALIFARTFNKLIKQEIV